MHQLKDAFRTVQFPCMSLRLRAVNLALISLFGDGCVMTIVDIYDDDHS